MCEKKFNIVVITEIRRIMQEKTYTKRLKFTDGLEQTSPLLCESITKEKVVVIILTLKATFTCSRWFKMIIE